jgi:hypothetical protein
LIVPAGSILLLRTTDGHTVELLTSTDVDLTGEADPELNVLVGTEPGGPVGEVEQGMADIPTEGGLLHVPALLRPAEGRLQLRPAGAAEPARPLQRRLAPRSGLVLPLRGSAHSGRPGSGPGGRLITFHGYTVDVGAGGLQARLVGDVGLRLPQQLRDVFVELDPEGPDSLAVGLRVVTFRSDVLRAQFSFISLADWIRLRARAEDAPHDRP